MEGVGYRNRKVSARVCVLINSKLGSSEEIEGLGEKESERAETGMIVDAIICVRLYGGAGECGCI